MRRLSLVLLALVLPACSTSLGRLGVVTPDAETVGLKLLRPNAFGSSCRVSLAGVPLQEGQPDVREALAQILALDAEGNVVANADIRWRRFVTGVYNRSCVEVRGDLARTVSTVVLPASPAHRQHGAH